MTINTTIDHTLLKQDATQAQLEKHCADALQYHFATVCVHPIWVPLCAKLLHGSPVKVCTVVGFPFGTNTTAAKAFETVQALKDGAEEIDMVLNIGALKDGHLELVKNDIAAVVQNANGHIVKVIIETCLLTREEKIAACETVVAAGAHFVKTSTGFSTAGATVEDVKLMKSVVGNRCKVKAAGGVRSYADVVAMLEAGAERIGTSAGVALMTATEVKTSY
jgi:deoxyribose-phosphate aldolase